MATDAYDDITARFSGAIVTLKVGDTGHVLRCHESLLKQNSPFFRAALDKHWKESISRQVILPDDEVAIVARYLEWLYCRQVTPPPEKVQDHHQTKYVWLVKAWIFGDKVQDFGFCNEVVSVMAYTIDTPELGTRYYPEAEPIKLIYSSTTKTSPLRKMVLDIWTARGASGIVARWIDDAPSEFTRDLLLEVCERRMVLEWVPAFQQRAKWFKKA